MAYTSNKKPGELTALTVLATDDVFVVGDTSDASEVAKKITKANLLSDLADETQTLTNKTIDGDNNTISNLAIGAEVTGASTDLTDTADLTYNADTDVSANGWVIDEDNMASDLATKVPTQQSVKAYVDAQAGGISNVVEDTTPQLGGSLDVNGNEITGAIDLHSSGDIIHELGDAAGTNKVSVRDSGAVEVAAIDSDGNITTSGTVDGRDVATDGTKLDGIEASADVTDVTNVTAAGALMDSEVTNLAQVKAFDTTDYATAAQGATADSAVQPTGTPVNNQVAIFTDASTVEGDASLTYDSGTGILSAGTSGKLAFGAVTVLDDTTGTTTLQNIDAIDATTETTIENAIDSLPNLASIGSELDMGANSIGFTMQTATGDGTTTVDWRNGNHFKFTFGAFNETFTFTAPTKPGVFTMTLIQDSVGSRTATWPGTVLWPGGTAPTLTTTATTGRDVISFKWDGTNYEATSTLDFS